MKYLLFFLLLTSLSFAEPNITCPTVAEIKSGIFGDWLPLYIKYEELASDEDVSNFRHFVTSLHIAIWDESYLENAHCFYEGNHPIFQKLILAQDAWRPVKNTYWNWVQPNSRAECKSSPAHCGFVK